MFDSLPPDDVDTLPVASTDASPRRVPPIPPTDGERLMRFRRRRDEVAFRELIEAHAPLVWGVCWQVLRHEHDAEDAFQATFLILARRAASIRETHSVASWLYRVAFRTALLARRRRLRRAEEPLMDEPLSTDEQLAAVHRREQCLMLLEELHALPARLRAPLALCYLEGRSRRAAADELGVTPASVKGLLARGTRLLRSRLLRRGVAMSTAMGVVAANASAAQAAMNPALVERTAVLGLGFAFHAMAGAGGGVPPGSSVATLAEKGLQAMTLATAAKPAAGMLSVCMAGVLAIASAAAPPASDDVAPGTLALDTSATEAVDAAPAADVAAPLDVVASSPSSGAAEATSAVAPTASATDDLDVEAPTTTIDVRSDPPTLATSPMGELEFRAAGPVVAATPTTEIPMPADVLVPSAVGLPGPVVQPLPPGALASPYAAPTPVLMPAPTAAPTQSSAAAVKLEIEYWERKAAGLEKKAEAMRLKAEQLANRGDEFRVETLELEAEATLALAEVKLCESNAQRLKDALAAAEQPATQPTPTMPIPSGFAPQPAHSPAPALPTTATPEQTPLFDGVQYDDFNATPDADGAPLETMRQQLAELQAANRLLIERIEHLEADHAGADATSQPPIR